MSADIRLRPVESEDVSPLALILANPSLVGRRGLHEDQPGLRSVASTSKSIEKLVDPEHGAARVVEADGIVGLVTSSWWWDALIPWANVVIDPVRQRHGHGTAAARAVLDGGAEPGAAASDDQDIVPERFHALPGVYSTGQPIKVEGGRELK
jgi:RimJ/RimL family protein N-acetyltransferase